MTDQPTTPEPIRLDSFEHPETGQRIGAAHAHLEDLEGRGEGPTHLAVQAQRGGAAFRWPLSQAKRLFAEHPEIRRLWSGQERPSSTSSSASSSTSSGTGTPPRSA
jgi:hypothetical protein